MIRSLHRYFSSSPLRPQCSRSTSIILSSSAISLSSCQSNFENEFKNVVVIPYGLFQRHYLLLQIRQLVIVMAVGGTNASQSEQNCLSQHTSSVTSFSSYPSLPVHLEKTISDDDEVVEHAPFVASYTFSHPLKQVKSDEVVSDSDKVVDPRENVDSVQLFPQRRQSIPLNICHKKKTEEEVFIVPYRDKFNLTTVIFEHIGDDLINDEQFDKAPLPDLIEEEESQTAMY